MTKPAMLDDLSSFLPAFAIGNPTVLHSKLNQWYEQLLLRSQGVQPYALQNDEFKKPAHVLATQTATLARLLADAIEDGLKEGKYR